MNQASSWLNDDILTEAVQIMSDIRDSGEYVKLNNPVPIGSTEAYLKFGVYGYVLLCATRDDGQHYPICYHLFMLDPLAGWFMPQNTIDLFHDREWGKGVRDAFRRGLVIEQGPCGGWVIGSKEDMNYV